jgi:hypothetical protein
MTDLAEAAEDAAEQQHPDHDDTTSPLRPATEAVAGPEHEPDDSSAPAPDEGAAREAQEETVAASEAAETAGQDALFSTDVPPVITPSAEDEGVTSFGGEPSDLDAIRDELGESEATEEPAAEVAAVEAPAVEAVVAAEVAAEHEATEALVEAGVPEGADDDPDAVEALLDAESAEGILAIPRDRTLSLPFFIYAGIWLVFAVAMVLVLRDAAVAGSLDAAAAYPVFILIGAILTLAGPVLALAIWLVKRSRSSAEERRGLFAVAMLRGALATFAGVAMWWIALVVLNYFKTGRFF